MAVTGVLVWLLARPAGGPELILGGMLVVDQMAVYFKLLLLVAPALALLMSAGFIERSRYPGAA